MIQVIYQSLYLFFVVLEIMMFAYVIVSWMFEKSIIHKILEELIVPLTVPIKWLLKLSIFQSRMDFSFIILYIIIFYMQTFFSNLIN